jgi:UDP-3-O-[3-hydroxymyristoyl] glucosamine N-acyltransferase
VSIGTGSVIENSALSHTIVGTGSKISNSKIAHSLIGDDTVLDGVVGEVTVGDNSEVRVSPVG